MGDGIGTEIGGNGILMMDVPSSDQDTTVHQNESCPDQDKSWMCMPITFLLRIRGETTGTGAAGGTH
nr:hypothetical protein Q903MT_gene2553 [Picea sitchensis]